MPRKLSIDHITNSVIEMQDKFLEQVYDSSRLPCIGIVVNNIKAFECRPITTILT